MALARIDFFKQKTQFDYLCRVKTEPSISASTRSVYFALLMQNNSVYWSERFEVDYMWMLQTARVDKDTYRRSMDYLYNNGFFAYYVKGKNQFSRAVVSLTVLTEKSVCIIECKSASEAVDISASSAHSYKHIIENRKEKTVDVVTEDVVISAHAQEKKIARQSERPGPNKSSPPAPSQNVVGQLSSIPSWTDILIEVVKTSHWKNTINHYFLDDSSDTLRHHLRQEEAGDIKIFLKSVFRTFCEQQADNFLTGPFPSSQEISKHFYNWLPVHLGHRSKSSRSDKTGRFYEQPLSSYSN